MKFQRFCLSILFSLFFLSSAQASFLNESGGINEEVREITRKFSVFLSSSNKVNPETVRKIIENNSVSLEEFNSLAQAVFKRPEKAERLSEEAISSYKALCSALQESDKSEILTLFKRVGNIDACYPSEETKVPDYVLIQGSTVQNMRERVMDLSDQIDNKEIILKPTTQIFFFTGERKLFLDETKDVLLNTAPYQQDENWHWKGGVLPTDEREAAKLVWEQLKISPQLRKQGIVFTESTKKEGFTRAQTEDGVASFINTQSPKEGIYLIGSQQPFVYYQTLVTKRKFAQKGYHKNMIFVGVGPRASVENYPIDITIGILMDNLARTIFEEKAFLDIKHNNE